MARQPTEQNSEVNAETRADAGNASRPAVQELAKAYQDMAARNAKNLTDAMQALVAVKTPTEFMELQQRLVREGVEAAVKDSQRIAQLTAAVFTSAFQPLDPGKWMPRPPQD